MAGPRGCRQGRPSAIPVHTSLPAEPQAGRPQGAARRPVGVGALSRAPFIDPYPPSRSHRPGGRRGPRGAPSASALVQGRHSSIPVHPNLREESQAGRPSSIPFKGALHQGRPSSIPTSARSHGPGGARSRGGAGPQADGGVAAAVGLCGAGRRLLGLRRPRLPGCRARDSDRRLG